MISSQVAKDPILCGVAARSSVRARVVTPTFPLAPTPATTPPTSRDDLELFPITPLLEKAVKAVACGLKHRPDWLGLAITADTGR